MNLYISSSIEYPVGMNVNHGPVRIDADSGTYELAKTPKKRIHPPHSIHASDCTEMYRRKIQEICGPIPEPSDRTHDNKWIRPPESTVRENESALISIELWHALTVPSHSHRTKSCLIQRSKNQVTKQGYDQRGEEIGIARNQIV